MGIEMSDIIKQILKSPLMKFLSINTIHEIIKEYTDSSVYYSEDDDYYCYSLENNINFENVRITPCCPPADYIRPSVPYMGGPLPLEAIVQMRGKTREEIRQGISPCLQCPFLTKGKRRINGILFETITLNHFGHCNARCSYCSAWYPSNYEKYKPNYEIFEALEWLFINNLINPTGSPIIWGGGEPTILPEFEKVMGLLSKYNKPSLVNTNAIIYSENLVNALSRNLTTIQISLDAGDKETYKKMKGLDLFDQVVDNIKKYSKVGNKRITLKYIVNDVTNSKESILKFLKIAGDLNISNIAISPENHETYTKEISNQTLESIVFFIKEADKQKFNVNVLYAIFGIEYSQIIKKMLNSR